MPKNTPVKIREAFHCLAKCARNVCRKSISNATLRVLRRLLSCNITAMFPQCYTALSGLPVTVKVLDKIKISFYLEFRETYDKRRTLYLWDLRKVIYAIACFEETLKLLQGLATRLPKKVKVNNEQKECFESITKELRSTSGKKAFERILVRFRDLVVELIEWTKGICVPTSWRGRKARRWRDVSGMLKTLF